MDWRSESDNEEFNEKPYSALSAEDPDRFLSRPKYPLLLLGGGVILLIVLIVFFFSGSSERTYEESGDIAARLDLMSDRVSELSGVLNQVRELENRIAGLEENLQFVNDGQMTPDPELGDQVQANSKLIKDAVNRLDAIEKRLNQMESQIAANESKLADRRASDQSPQKTTVYVVKKGDTPYSIARKYNIKLDQLLRMNGLDDKAKIYPGQELNIPK